MGIHLEHLSEVMFRISTIYVLSESKKDHKFWSVYCIVRKKNPSGYTQKLECQYCCLFFFFHRYFSLYRKITQKSFKYEMNVSQWVLEYI